MLHRIFHKIFDISITRANQPLKEAILQAESICLTCKNWAAAFAEELPPLAVKIQTPGEYEAALWITKFPVVRLHISQDLPVYADDDSSTGSDDWETDDSADDFAEPSNLDVQGYRLGRGAELNNLDDWYGLPIDCVHMTESGLRISLLNKLEYLQLDCPRTTVWSDIGTQFSAYPIQSLKNLTHLCLIEFDMYDLDDLPLSVHDLILVYPERQGERGDSFSMCPTLPKESQLDVFQIMSFCTLGIALDELWNTCRHIKIDAPCVLLGVPVDNPEVIRLFERPYREGRYVPPHILADGEALEASIKTVDETIDCMLKGLARSSKTEILQFSSNTSKMIKVVPGTGGGKSVEFLHNVCRSRIMYVYGVTTDDIMGRVEYLEASCLLPRHAFDMACNDETGDYRITVDKQLSR